MFVQLMRNSTFIVLKHYRRQYYRSLSHERGQKKGERWEQNAFIPLISCISFFMQVFVRSQCMILETQVSCQWEQNDTKLL